MPTPSFEFRPGLFWLPLLQYRWNHSTRDLCLVHSEDKTSSKEPKEEVEGGSSLAGHPERPHQILSQIAQSRKLYDGTSGATMFSLMNSGKLELEALVERLS